MIKLRISDVNGESVEQQFDQDEITIGRVAGNDIILPKNNISKKHCKIIKRGNTYMVNDLGSTNGTFVNGSRVEGSVTVTGADKVCCGNFIIEIICEAGAVTPPVDVGEENGSAQWDVEDMNIGNDDWGDEWEDEAPAAPAASQSQADDDFDLDMLIENAGKPVSAPPQSAGGAPRISNADIGEIIKAAAPAAPAGRKPLPPPPPLDDDDDDFDEVTPPPVGGAPIPFDHRGDKTPAPAAKAAPAPAVDELEDDFEEEFDADDEVTPPPMARPVVPAAKPAPVAPKAPPAPAPKRTPAPAPAPAHAPQVSDDFGDEEDGDEYAKALATVQERLVQALDLRRIDVQSMGEDELKERSRDAIEEIIDQMDMAGELPEGLDVDQLIDDVINESLGLGPLEQLIADDSISEIMVNRPDQIYIERNGKLQLSTCKFSSAEAVMGVIERIVAPLGRRIDESSPMVDARLKDGSRVNAIIPPLALKGPCLTIRKFKHDPLKIQDLVNFGSLSPEMASFIEVAVVARKNIVISGGTGSGKTTTLNVLSAFIPERERIVTVEDAAELRLVQPHVVSLESRPANIEGKGAVTIRDLVKNCLRMRPDRIVVGECRGGETLDMLQAMNTGHDGSLTTLHANTPRDCLSRLETMVLMSGMELPIKAIRDQISGAIDIIVQQSRFPDGSRRITHITEVTGMEGEVITMQDIFLFKQEGYNDKGKVVGRHVATGFVPKFYEDLEYRGIKADFSVFHNDEEF